MKRSRETCDKIAVAPYPSNLSLVSPPPSPDPSEPYIHSTSPSETLGNLASRTTKRPASCKPSSKSRSRSFGPNYLLPELGRLIVAFIGDVNSLHKVSQLSHFYRSLAEFQYPMIVRARCSVDFEFRQLWGSVAMDQDRTEVFDSQRGLKATLLNGASLGTEGLCLKGEGEHATCTPWKLGGTFSVETYVKYNSFNRYSRVFDFGNGLDNDNVLLYNNGTDSEIRWSDYRGPAPRSIQAKGTFDPSAWTHVVVTVTDSSTHIYKNGVLVGGTSKYRDNSGPHFISRKHHIIGGSHVGVPFEGSGEVDCFFDGHVGFLRFFEHELKPEDIKALYSISGRVKPPRGCGSAPPAPTYDDLAKSVTDLKSELASLRTANAKLLKSKVRFI